MEWNGRDYTPQHLNDTDPKTLQGMCLKIGKPSVDRPTVGPSDLLIHTGHSFQLRSVKVVHSTICRSVLGSFLRYNQA